MKNYNEKYFDMVMEFGKLIKNFLSRLPATDKKDIKEKALTKYNEIRTYVESVFSDSGKIDFEIEIKKAKLSDAEIMILYYFVFSCFAERDFVRQENILELLSTITGLSKLEVVKAISKKGKLYLKGFITGGDSFSERFSLSSLSIQIITEGKVKKRKKTFSLKGKIVKPQELVEYLSKYIIGQDEALKTISAAIYKHLLTIKLNLKKSKNAKIRKSNILIIGPTGVGKTYMVKLIADFLKVPLVRVNATQYTETGYVGMDVEQMVEQLYKEAMYDEEKARNGIIFIDEIDKIAAKDCSSGHYSTKDVRGLSVQQELLKLLEEEEIVYEKKGGFLRESRTYKIDNVLFIAAGAFSGIEDIISQRLKEKRKIGFSTESEKQKASLMDEITYGDLEKYGLIPEFLGRFGAIINMKNLSLEILKDIITKAKNGPMEQYNAILKESGIDFQFSEKDAEEIAAYAYSLGTGARSIAAIFEKKVNYILSNSAIKDDNNLKKENA